MRGRGSAERRGSAKGGGFAFLAGFGVAAAGVGAARALTTTYVPVLLDRIDDAPGLIGMVMLVNAVAGFAVPIGVGVWSDRRRRGRLGRRLPFVIGGVALSAGGLVAIALGTTTSYVLLGLAAAAVYVGLNAAATAHRSIVVESFEDARRPAATSAQEVAMLLGGMLALGAGAALIEVSAPALFAVGAVLVLVLAAPTVAVVRRRLVPAEADASGEAADASGEAAAASGEAAAASGEAAPGGAPRDHRPTLRELASAARLPGAREVLLAQILWLVAYGALPAFFLLYADHALGVGPGPASGLLAGYGVLTGAAMLVAGRARPERVLPLLLTGASLLGAGLIAAAPATTIAAAAVPFAAAAVGFGLVTALGFPYFARFVPDGESGRYTGLFFAVRAIGSAITLPAAGLLVAVTDSYRVLPLVGVAALVSLVPLARAARREPARPGPALAPVRTVTAIVPAHLTARLEAVVAGLAPHVDDVLVVADGVPPDGEDALGRLAARPRVQLVRLPENAGKGDAVAAGARAVLARAERPDAIVVIDADGQHPPERVPAFVAAAAHAELVIGDRSGDRAAMPRTRRFTNAVSSAVLTVRLGRPVPDAQCGMRLIRTAALERAPLPPGRYEAETHHLRAAARAGLALAWVPIPAIYDGASSSFRPVRDTARVLRALVGGSAPRGERRRLHRPSREFARTWGLRLGMVVAGTMVVGALMPLLAPADQGLFVMLNSLGGGPEWLYEALDPHSRNYLLLGLVAAVWAAATRTRATVAVACAVLFAGLFSDLLVQAVYLLYERPRPEEIGGLEVLLVTPERTWAHIASFPSGHMVVTTAIAVAGMTLVPALRTPFWIYVGLIALTRITFGAHFPLDVAVGAVFGYYVGLFSAWLPHAVGLTDRTPASAFPRLSRPRPARARAA